MFPAIISTMPFSLPSSSLPVFVNQLLLLLLLPLLLVVVVVVLYLPLGGLRGFVRHCYWRYRRRRHAALYPYAVVVEPQPHQHQHQSKYLQRPPPNGAAPHEPKRLLPVRFGTVRRLFRFALRFVLHVVWDGLQYVIRHTALAAFLWVCQCLFSLLQLPRTAAPSSGGGAVNGSLSTIHTSNNTSDKQQEQQASERTNSNERALAAVVVVDTHKGEQRVAVEPRSIIQRGLRRDVKDGTTMALPRRKSVAFAQPDHVDQPTTNTYNNIHASNTAASNTKDNAFATPRNPFDHVTLVQPSTAATVVAPVNDNRSASISALPYQTHSRSNPSNHPYSVMQSPGVEASQAMQEPLRVRRQQILREREEGWLKRRSTVDTDTCPPSQAKRPRIQPPLKNGRLQLSQFQATTAASRRLRYARPDCESNKRARQDELVQELSQPPLKRNTESTYRGPYGTIKQSSFNATKLNEGSSTVATTVTVTNHDSDSGPRVEESKDSSTSVFSLGGFTPAASSDITVPLAGAVSNPAAPDANGTQPVFSFGAPTLGALLAPNPPQPHETADAPSAVSATAHTTSSMPGATISFGAPANSESIQPATQLAFGATVLANDSEGGSRPIQSAETQIGFSFGAGTSDTVTSQAAFSFGATVTAPNGISNPPPLQTNVPVIPFGTAFMGSSNPEQSKASSLLELTKQSVSQGSLDAETSSSIATGPFQFGGPSANTAVPSLQFGSTSANTPQFGPVTTVFTDPATTSTAPAFGVPSFGSAPSTNPSLPVPQFGVPVVAFGAGAIGANSSPAPRTMARRRAALRGRRT